MWFEMESDIRVLSSFFKLVVSPTGVLQIMQQSDTVECFKVSLSESKLVFVEHDNMFVKLEMCQWCVCINFSLYLQHLETWRAASLLISHIFNI